VQDDGKICPLGLFSNDGHGSLTLHMTLYAHRVIGSKAGDCSYSSQVQAAKSEFIHSIHQSRSSALYTFVQHLTKAPRCVTSARELASPRFRNGGFATCQGTSAGKPTVGRQIAEECRTSIPTDNPSRAYGKHDPYVVTCDIAASEADLTG
jgi:hypothetical protein